ncbi:putative phosphatidylinositol-3,4-bisphosphate 4-phosphatase [Trypoxylus dichotomus]
MMAGSKAYIQNCRKNGSVCISQHFRNVMEPYADEFLPVTWSLLHDNDPKHAARTVKQWLDETQIRVLEWPIQNLDLNLIENLWGDVEVVIKSKSPAILDEL